MQAGTKTDRREYAQPDPVSAPGDGFVPSSEILFEKKQGKCSTKVLAQGSDEFGFSFRKKEKVLARKQILTTPSHAM